MHLFLHVSFPREGREKSKPFLPSFLVIERAQLKYKYSFWLRKRRNKFRSISFANSVKEIYLQSLYNCGSAAWLCTGNKLTFAAVNRTFFFHLSFFFSPFFPESQHMADVYKLSRCSIVYCLLILLFSPPGKKLLPRYSKFRRNPNDRGL